MRISNKILRFALILLFWILVWWIGAEVYGKPLLFPTPLAVLKTLAELLGTADFYLATLQSLKNIFFGFFAALLIGCLLAVLTARFKLLRDLLFPIMSVIKATPVASFIILLLIWIGAATVPFVITALIVLPIVWTNLDVGFQSIDPQLVEVAIVYRFSYGKRMRYLTLPSLYPYLISACRTSMGLAWKAGIAAEIIAMPKNTIGMMIGDAKQYILTSEMFAWTLTVILLSILIEFGFSALLRKLASKYPLEGGADHAES